MSMRINVLAIGTLALLAACTQVTMFGHAVKNEPASAAAPAGATAGNAATASSTPAAQANPPPITRLIIDYTPAATKQTADDAKFSDDALRKAVADGLAARKLADLANPGVVRVAAIQVDEFDVRATSNVVLMGRVASSGVLGALVRIRDGSSTQLREFHVRAELSLNVVHNGTDKNPLKDLYREFTSLIADELTGTVRKPKPVQQRQ